MFTTSISADMHMAGSTTYSLPIFDSRLTIEKTQLQQLTEMAYQYGYREGLKQGKTKSEVYPSKNKTASHMNLVGNQRNIASHGPVHIGAQTPYKIPPQRHQNIGSVGVPIPTTPVVLTNNVGPNMQQNVLVPSPPVSRGQLNRMAVTPGRMLRL